MRQLLKQTSILLDIKSYFTCDKSNLYWNMTNTWLGLYVTEENIMILYPFFMKLIFSFFSKCYTKSSTPWGNFYFWDGAFLLLHYNICIIYIHLISASSLPCKICVLRICHFYKAIIFSIKQKVGILTLFIYLFIYLFNFFF